MNAALRITLAGAMFLTVSAAALAQEDLWPELNARSRTLLLEGKYAEGVDTAKKALEQAEKMLGPEHPNTAMSQNNLAEFYFKLGR
jgi:hypothetical protein